MDDAIAFWLIISYFFCGILIYIWVSIKRERDQSLVLVLWPIFLLIVVFHIFTIKIEYRKLEIKNITESDRQYIRSDPYDPHNHNIYVQLVCDLYSRLGGEIHDGVGTIVILTNGSRWIVLSGGRPANIFIKALVRCHKNEILNHIKDSVAA